MNNRIDLLLNDITIINNDDITNITKIYEYDKSQINDLINKNIESAPNSPFKIVILEKVLEQIISSDKINFENKLKCLEVLENNKKSLDYLESFINLDLIEIIKLNLNGNYYFNHFMYSYNSKLNHDKCSNILKCMMSNETIIRGNLTYYKLQQIATPLKLITNMSGIGKMLHMKELLPASLVNISCLEYYNKALTEARHGLSQRLIDNYIPVLQLLHLNNLLTPEICENAQILITTQYPNLVGDLADFFRSIDMAGFERFRRFGYNIINALPNNGGNIVNGSQSVHALDKSRDTLIKFLMDNSINFEQTLLIEEDHKTNAVSANHGLPQLDDGLALRARDEIARDVPSLNKCIKENIKYKSFRRDILDCDQQKVKLAIERIHTDNSIIYCSDTSIGTILNVFNRICFIIANHEHESVLKVRLIEELADAQGTCFSGHLNRLFNTFAGIEEDLITVNIKSEIIIMIKVQLQTIIDNTTDIDLQDNIINSLGLPENEWKPELITFLKKECEILKDRIFNSVSNNTTLDDFSEWYSSVANKYFGINIYL